jgi:tetratricopeptide (TPR) repeat protein
VLERLYGTRHPQVAGAIGNRALAHWSAGRYDRAVDDSRRCIDLLTDVAGLRNPHLDLPYANMGDYLLALARPQEAKVAYERSLSFQAGRPAGVVTIQALAGLAAAENDLGHPDAALDAAARGLSAAEALGQSGMNTWGLLLAIGRARAAQGDRAAQREQCARILAQQKAQGVLSPDAMYYPDALTCIGESELALGRPDAALAFLEQSIALPRRAELWELPAARFALARALAAAGREPTRARELARAAQDGLRGVPGREQEVATIERWLAQRAGHAATPLPAH